MRMPRPPPPAAALKITGKPAASATSTASASSLSGSSLPGTTGTPACLAITRACALSPIKRIASGEGPMNVRPQARQMSAKAGFSARKP
jgi:hypothetical protein